MSWMWTLVPVVGVIAWTFVVIGGGRRWARSSGRLEAGIASRLDAIDARLAAVEKTLNDIP